MGMAQMKKDVLDHGYIELVETYGSDEAIVTAARQSTQKGFLGWGVEEECARCGGVGECSRGGDSDRDSDEKTRCNVCKGKGRCINKPGDEKLLRFMWENQHSTPFEFAGAVIEVQAPIFVFREWHRHRTQSYSEASARYAPLPDVNYIPTVERLNPIALENNTNKQAGPLKSEQWLTPDRAEAFRQQLAEEYARCQKLYETALQDGVPKELARLVLPVGRYSRMRASANLRNWLAFLTLRQAPNAQWEIRQYADALHNMLAEKFPRTLALFDEGKK
jgi:thymidylate synthase (FAD)